ncbi:putative N-acetyltransferase [Candidatus Methanobinarius endosymbioticus]|uniref:Putative N-acetyltransferase n=1 Tax=Candidatus Methanobinarius endosymbioticus TaxID=2006182 RepID=A0A366MDU8_9EURY|nr:putative N-acetyltransferase [Candidatus Methanobinarius endosymbioticus]
MSFPEFYEIEVLKQLFDFSAEFSVAQSENYIVWYIIFWIVKENRGHIVSLAVDEEYKRQRIGSKLINTAIATFLKFNIFNVTLELRTENKGALDFYQLIDFKLDRTVSNYYEDDTDVFKMSFNFSDLKEDSKI